MKLKRSLVKFAVALSVFVSGISISNVVFADSDPATTIQASNDVNSKRDAVVKLAKKQIGKRYVFGGTTPAGFDCSGLTQYVYKNAVSTVLPRTTYGQIVQGKSVSLKNLKKGDLLFWGNYHVGIYTGNGKFVHAPAPGQNVKEQTLSSFYPSSAKRVLN